MNLKSVGLYANPKKDTEFEGTRMLADCLRQRGVAVSFDKEGMPEGENDVIDYASVDCLFVLGGDGTLLRAAHKASQYGVCILGFNLGRLGFLTEAKIGQADAVIEDLQKGRYFIEERVMLDCSVYNAGKELYNISALNDAAVLKKDVSRMISLELFIGGALADNVSCDGMLVSTPTGSTGYSLSAGGPILSPDLKCLLTTPICPHSLHSRALVVSEDREIVIRPTAPDNMILATDGIQRIDILDGQEVRVRRSKRSAHFIRFREDYFYPLLRSKFVNWDR